MDVEKRTMLMAAYLKVNSRKVYRLAMGGTLKRMETISKERPRQDVRTEKVFMLAAVQLIEEDFKTISLMAKELKRTKCIALRGLINEVSRRRGR